MEAPFRPSRPKMRASLGGGYQPQEGNSDAGKENVDLEGAVRRKKRAQSFGGQGLKQHGDGLSPRKKARRSLAPGRSILKGALSASNINTQPSPLYTPDESPSNTGTFNFTATFNQKEVTTSFNETGDRRKSLGRRVSFAQTAHLREFQRDEPEEGSDPSSPALDRQNVPHFDDENNNQAEQAQENRKHQRNSSVNSLDEFISGQNIGDTSNMSMDLVGDESATAGFNSAFAFPQNNGDLLADEAEPFFLADDSAMDLVDPQAATLAFAQNTVIVTRQRPEILADDNNDEPDLSSSSEAEQELSLSIAAALGAGAEYEVPLHKAGVSAPSPAQSANMFENSEQDMSMDVEGQTVVNGLIISDGLTSRRMSHGGSIRRGSVAPGLKALALLDAEEEDEDEEEREDGNLEVDDQPQETGAQHNQHAAASDNSEDEDATMEMSITPQKSVPKSTRFSLAPATRSPAIDKSSPRTSGNSPAQSKAALMAAVAKSPLKSPSSLRFVQQASPDKEADDGQENDERHGMSLEDFFALTKTDFVPTMFAKKRKSGIGSKKQLSLTTKGKPTLGDQVIAMGCLVHDLEMYQTMSKELKSSMHENIAWLEEMNEILENDMPDVFRRFRDASPEQRLQMETHFKLAKSYFRLEVRNEWYAFRANAVESVCEVFEHHQKGIDSDLEALAQTKGQARAILPDLRAKYAEIAQELATEIKRNDELASCDEEHLSGLREAVTEQEAQIDIFTRDKVDVDNQVKRNRAKIAELQIRQREAEAGIASARQICKQIGHASPAEVSRKIDDLVTIQDIHGWSLVDFNDSEFKLVFQRELCAIIRVNQHGMVEKLELSMIQDCNSGLFESHSQIQEQRAKTFLFDRMRAVSENIPNASEAPSTVVWRISSTRKSMQSLMAQVGMAGMRYPLECKLLTKKSRAVPFLRIALRMFSPLRGASFTASLELTGEELFDDAISDFGCVVEAQFGEIDCQELTYVMRERLSAGGKMSILEACMEAEAKLR